MLLKQKSTGHLMEALDIYDLTNPYRKAVAGRLQWGEEPSDVEAFSKETLCFPSGEDLPRCWYDDHYRDREIDARKASQVRSPAVH